MTSVLTVGATLVNESDDSLTNVKLEVNVEVECWDLGGDECGIDYETYDSPQFFVSRAGDDCFREMIERELMSRFTCEIGELGPRAVADILIEPEGESLVEFNLRVTLFYD